MKFATLLMALTAAALAQEAAPEKPAPDKAPAAPAPAPVPARPELRPSKLDPKPIDIPPLQPSSPDLPPLPDRPEEPRTKPDPTPQILPDDLPPGKKPAIGSVAERPKTRTTLKPPASATDLDLRIRFRKAQSKAASEPTLQAIWEESRTATTDFAKRAALKSYYDKLYRRMLTLDKGITPIVEDRRLYNLRRLEQTRIAPTDPLDEEATLWRD